MKKRNSVNSENESRNLKILLDVSKSISSTLDLEKVNALILDKASWALGTDHASLFLLDEKGRHLMLAAAKGFTKNEMDNLAILGSWERINYRVAKNKKPLIVNDLMRHPVFKKEELPFAKKRLPLNSFLSVPLEADAKVIGVLIVSSRIERFRIFTGEDQRLLMALANHVSIALLNAGLYKRLEELFMSTIASLVNAVDAKDPYTRGHSKRVMKYSLAIAEKMDLSEDFTKRLRLASLLHDVGKIGITDVILGKTSTLSPEEAGVMRKHPIIGVNIVSSIIGSERFSRGIADHHEWVNGKGYPNGLKAKKISLEGKIIAIADAFDALTTDRPYQSRFTTKEACLEIARSSGTQFDPKAIKAFLRSFSDENDIWQT